MIELTCPSCGATYRLKDELAGRHVRCAKCKMSIRVPAGGAPAAPVPADGIPVAKAADDIPVAKAADGRKRLLLIGAAAGGGLLVVGLLIALLFGGRPYDLDELRAAAHQIKGRAEEVLPLDTDVSSLGVEELVQARDGLPGVIEEYGRLQERLAPLAEYQADDAALRELADAVALRESMADSYLREVEDELWPRPGGPGAMAGRVAPSVPVVRVRGRGSSGSGFLVRHRNRLHVVTNRHVVERGRDGFALQFLLGGDAAGTSVDIDVGPEAVHLVHRFWDLAVISLGDKADVLAARKVRPLRREEAVKVSEDVWVVGHPGLSGAGLLTKAFDKGYISAFIGSSRDEPDKFRFTAPLNKGNSGGPVLNDKGRVVGIVFGGELDKNRMSLAVHVRRLNKLLAGEENLPADEIRRVIQPGVQFPRDLADIAEHMKPQGYALCEWTDADKKPLFVLPPGLRQTFVFDAEKGKRYRVMVLTTRLQEAEYFVHVKASKKIVFAKLRSIGQAGMTPDGLEGGPEFEAAETAPHEVVLVNGSHPRPISAYAGVLVRSPPPGP